MDTFFENIFRGKPDDHLINLWTLSDKHSQYFTNIDEFEEATEQIEGDIYFGLGTSTIKNGTYNRFSANQIQGTGCIHVDIDFGTKGHNAENLPPTIQEAMNIAQRITVPSYVIESGHGIHAYYMLTEYACTPETTKQIATLQRDFQKILSCYTEYDLDMTHDISRVLRIPGSKNYKDPDDVKDCKVLVDNSNLRYTVKNIEKDLETTSNNSKPIKKTIIPKPTQLHLELDIPEKSLSGMDITGNKIVYDQTIKDDEKYRIINRRLIRTPDRKIDPELIVAIESVFDQDFKNIWTHQKTLSDPTTSAYDLALTNMCADMDFAEQDMCDLLITHRRFHKSDLKLTHNSYYGRTIYKAWLFKESMKSAEEQKEAYANCIQNAPKEKADLNLTEEEISKKLEEKQELERERQRDLFRKNIEDTIKIPIKSIIKYDADPEPEFHIRFNESCGVGRDIILGNFKNLDKQMYFIAKVKAALTGLPIYSKAHFNLNKQQWQNVSNWLNEIMIVIETDKKVFNEPKLKDWILRYADTQSVEKDTSRYNNKANETLLYNGILYFDPVGLHKYIKNTFDNGLNLTRMRNIMSQIECKKRDIMISDGTTVEAWSVIIDDLK